MFVFTLFIVLFGAAISPFDSLATALVAFAITVLGLRLAFHIVPSWVRNLVGEVLNAVFGLPGTLLKFVFGTGIKGRK